MIFGNYLPISQRINSKSIRNFKQILQFVFYYLYVFEKM